MSNNLYTIIERVRRGTRNPDVIALCDELQRKLIDAARGRNVEKPRLTRAQIQRNYRLRKKGALK